MSILGSTAEIKDIIIIVQLCTLSLSKKNKNSPLVWQTLCALSFSMTGKDVLIEILRNNVID